MGLIILFVCLLTVRLGFKDRFSWTIHLSLRELIRIYYINGNKDIIEQVTVDDTYVNELLKKNLIKQSEIATHPQKHMLTKALGIFGKIDAQVKILGVDKGYILLCSDGLTNMLSNEDILQTIRDNNFVILSDKLVDFANINGGMDNITAVVVEI